MLKAMSLSGMTPKELLDAERKTKNDCIDHIQSVLIYSGNGAFSLSKAEKIYEYFASKSKEFLVYEFVLALTDEDYNFSALAEEILEDQP
jgi:hypothetical protein